MFKAICSFLRFHGLRRYYHLFAFILLCLGCAQAQRPELDTPMSFEVATRMIAYDLFAQIWNQQSLQNKVKVYNFVIDKVINADTGDELTISAKMAEIVKSTAEANFPKFMINTITPDNIGAADFVVMGVVKLENFNVDASKKLPKVYFSIIDMKSSQIAAHSEAWILSNSSSEFKPTQLYSDSPMYIKDAHVDALIATAKATAGSEATAGYFNSLATTALLSEASDAYDKGNFKLALGLFAKAAERDDGKIMKTFAGMYQCFFKLEKMNDAESAFGKLVEIGIKNGNLSVKFLFKVNETNFYGAPEELLEYGIWERQIAHKIDESDACVEIAGHASKGGSADYNKRLSAKRADQIQQHLFGQTPDIKNKTTATGKGFEENIVGTGTNDERDAIDRRVEFKVVNCN